MVYMVYPTALVRAKVLVQETFHPTGTVTMQGNATVLGNTRLGNATTDSIAFYGGNLVQRQGTITDLSYENITGDSNNVNITGGINTRFDNVKTAVNAIINRLEALNLIAPN